MPSLNDVFNELVGVNGRLDQLHNDVAAGTAATLQTRDRVNAVEATASAGFSAVVQGLQVVAGQQHQALLVLEHIAAQDETIICVLEHISSNTCGLLNESVRQTALLTRIDFATEELRMLAEAAQPAAALAFAERQRLQARLDECCPPDPSRPACEYEACPAPERPDVDDRPPRIPDFEPPRHD